MLKWNFSEWVKKNLLDVKSEVTTHLAKNVTDEGGAHGLEIEEGTFTPIVLFGGATDGIAYTRNNGRYTKVGNQVVCEINVVLSNKGTATGVATISGLPFASSSNSLIPAKAFNVSETSRVLLPVDGIDYISRLSSNGTALSLLSNRNGNTATNITDSQFVNNSGFWFTFSYFTD